MKLTKNQKSVADKVEAGKAYTLKEAIRNKVQELEMEQERIEQIIREANEYIKSLN